MRAEVSVGVGNMAAVRVRVRSGVSQNDYSPPILYVGPSPRLGFGLPLADAVSTDSATGSDPCSPLSLLLRFFTCCLLRYLFRSGGV